MLLKNLVVDVASRSEARRPGRTHSSRDTRNRPRFRRRQQSLPLQFLTGKLFGATDRFRPFADFPLRWLFVMFAKLHFPKDAFALQLPFQRLKRLVDIVISNENLHEAFLFNRRI